MLCRPIPAYFRSLAEGAGKFQAARVRPHVTVRSCLMYIKQFTGPALSPEGHSRAKTLPIVAILKMAGFEVARASFQWASCHWKVLLAAFIIIRAVYRRYIHPLRHVPGPFLASFTSLWLLAVQYSPRQHWVYVDLHKRYGPVVRISPYRVIFTSAEALQEYFLWDKSRWWRAFAMHPTVSNHGGVLESGPHKIAKAKVAGAYSLTNILKAESVVDNHVVEFMDQLSARTDTIFDFAPWLQYFAFDVVMDIAFSTSMNFIRSGYDVRKQIESIHTLLFTAEVMALFPSIPQLVNHKLWWPLLSPKPTAKNGIGAIIGLCQRTVNPRLENPALKKSDILQWLIDHRDKEGNTLSEEEIRQESFAPITAGSDTTASGLRSMILEITTNPRIYNKLMAQIDAADNAGLLSTPPTYEEIQRHIPYIDAIRKEALRVRPASAAPFFRVAPTQGATIGGFYIPAGTEVGMVSWAIARDPVYFGNDVDVFRPERWTDEKDEYRKKMRDKGDVSFSSGPRMCTGRNLAVLEMVKMPIEFLRRFELEVVNTGRPWVEVGSLALLHHDFRVVLKQRTKAGKE